MSGGLADDIALAMESLRTYGIRPTAFFVHPTTYVRTRRGFAGLAIRDALGGRRRHGARNRSRLPFRARRAAALAAVHELWRRERADQGLDWVR